LSNKHGLPVRANLGLCDYVFIYGEIPTIYLTFSEVYSFLKHFGIIWWKNA